MQNSHSKINLNDLKQIDIKSILSAFGIMLNGKNKLHCINPDHEDKTPSLSYNPQSNNLHCFACNNSFDTIGLVQTVKNLSFQKSCNYLQKHFIDEGKDLTLSQKAPYSTYTEAITTPVTYKQMSPKLCEIALSRHKYLVENWAKFESKITWSIEAVLGTLTGYDPQQKRFCFVESSPEGSMINLKYHKDSKGNPPYSVGDGKCKLYPMMLIQDYDKSQPLYIFEGEKDTLTAISNGLQACTVTTGAKGIPRDLTLLANFKNIIVCYDNDKAGRTGAVRMAKTIKKQYPQITVIIKE